MCYANTPPWLFLFVMPKKNQKRKRKKQNWRDNNVRELWNWKRYVCGEQPTRGWTAFVLVVVNTVWWVPPLSNHRGDPHESSFSYLLIISSFFLLLLFSLHINFLSLLHQTPPKTNSFKTPETNQLWVSVLEKEKGKLKFRIRMRALNSHFALIDLHTSWHSANQIPISTLNSLQSSKFISTVSKSFHRTCRGRKGIITSSRSSASEIRSPEIRRPSDRLFSGNGSFSNASNLASTSSSPRSEVAAELKMFLELLPLRMRRELYKHDEIEQLIEVVMDLGRNPIARFPSGDWIISQNPIKQEDLRHAISKVIQANYEVVSSICTWIVIWSLISDLEFWYSMVHLKFFYTKVNLLCTGQFGLWLLFVSNFIPNICLLYLIVFIDWMVTNRGENHSIIFAKKGSP